MLKNEKNQIEISNDDKEYIEKIKLSFKEGNPIKKDVLKEQNIFEQVAELFPWEFLQVKENTK